MPHPNTTTRSRSPGAWHAHRQHRSHIWLWQHRIARSGVCGWLVSSQLRDKPLTASNRRAICFIGFVSATQAPVAIPASADLRPALCIRSLPWTLAAISRQGSNPKDCTLMMWINNHPSAKPTSVPLIHAQRNARSLDAGGPHKAGRWQTEVPSTCHVPADSVKIANNPRTRPTIATVIPIPLSAEVTL